MDARGNTLVAVDREQVKGVIDELVDDGVESLTVSLDQLLRRRPPRAGDRRPRGGAAPGLPGDDQQRGAARVPRVRAHADGVHELLRAPAGGVLRRPAAVLAERPRREDRGRHPALGRGRDDPARGGAQPGLRGAERPVAAASPARSTWRRGRASRTCSPSTWAAPRPTCRCARASRRSAARPRSATSGSRSRASTCTPSARAAARSRTSPSSPARCASARSPRAPSRVPPPTARAATEPTVTDANVVLGHLPADLIGGEMSLDVEAARTAVKKVADAMDLCLEEAADGIIRIVNENMAGALRVISVQRGHDPREFALVAFGGAGPLHANAVAELMGSFPVIVPPSPGLLCALGDLVAGLPQRVRADADPAHLRGHRRAGDPGRPRTRARRNGWTRRASRPATSTSSSWPTCATAARATRSRCRGARTWRSASTSCTSSSTASGCPGPPRRSSTCARSGRATGLRPSCPRPSRTASSSSPAPTRATHLHPGAQIAGPSIITEFDSTTVVLEGYTAEVDRYFNILIRRAS